MINGHGDDKFRYKCSITSNFSSNVLSQVNLDGLKRHLCEHIDDIRHYPEPEPYTLEQRVASALHLRSEQVCVTNGATEAIYLIAQSYRGSHMLILQPSFNEYADACRIHNHRVESIDRLPDVDEGFRFKPDVDMVWICNPNNPTGRVLPQERMRRLVECNPRVCFVVDQSYEYFTRCPLFSAEEAVLMPNLLLIHSMTKHFAVPGLRIGYITADTNLLRRLRQNRMPWSVNQLAICAGIYLLDHSTEIAVDIDPLLVRTQRLCEALEGLGLSVHPTQTHIVLVRLHKGTASALKEYLAKQHGILIRDASNFEGLDFRYFRIASQQADENDRLVAAIAEWLKILE